jgi:hypothetical protein
MSKVSQFLVKYQYPVDQGYGLICFLEAYARLVGASFDELLDEGLESESVAQFYITAVRRIASAN